MVVFLDRRGEPSRHGGYRSFYPSRVNGVDRGMGYLLNGYQDEVATNLKIERVPPLFRLFYSKSENGGRRNDGSSSTNPESRVESLRPGPRINDEKRRDRGARSVRTPRRNAPSSDGAGLGGTAPL